MPPRFSWISSVCSGFESPDAQGARSTGREVLAALRKLGFVVVRVKGSHDFARHADGRAAVVPVHRGEVLGPGLLSSIARDCEIEVESLRRPG